MYSLSALTQLDVSDNKFTGTLSTSIGNLRHLEVLRVSQNQLRGQLPVELASLSGLRLAWFHFNQFTGSVPVEYCNNRGVGILEFLSADCGPETSPSVPCSCCSSCCDIENRWCDSG
mmetsp:Transcript_204/g.322  ORF Transcript_204/g.322 Transcript_204/m.322 type:complete len:117 (-) Transcript_204:2026-2376(-)